MKKLIFYFIVSLAFMNENSNILVLSPHSTIDSEDLDEGDINTINMLFIEGLNEHLNNIESSDVSCANDECALQELYETGNDEVVYTRLQKLGSKIIFLASILDSNNSFDSKATAMSVEDMEQVCRRLSKSIALRQTLEESADIDNITEQEEEEVARRRSLGRIGLSAGYFIPFDELVYTETSWDWDDGDVTDETKYPQLFKINYNYYNEFKNNTALLFEFGMAPPILYHIDLNFMKFENKLDTSPFYGGGVGFYSVRENDDYSSDSSDGGMCLNLQAGLVLYRTYDLNVLLRTKFIQILNEDLDRGIVFDVGVQWKMRAPNRGNQTVIVNRFPILEAIFDRD